ncbi:hypothetical protein ANN_18208 [Periplaneta americana]|uniref:Uncharacterized protein n=1 Tax=Periplaneta americana TaxID=6978 RepID=A0ABQ8SPK4_PERAM|nr:hypothetical protein ANN_18208 [Periplaneta americana]
MRNGDDEERGESVITMAKSTRDRTPVLLQMDEGNPMRTLNQIIPLGKFRITEEVWNRKGYISCLPMRMTEYVRENPQTITENTEILLEFEIRSFYRLKEDELQRSFVCYLTCHPVSENCSEFV